MTGLFTFLFFQTDRQKGKFIFVFNRSLLHSGNLERGPNGSYQNSGNATPGGGSGDYSGGGGGGGGIQQVNMANGVGSELPTMVMKDDLDHSQPNQCNNDATTISSDSFR